MTTEVTNGQIGQKWPVSKMYFLIFTIDNQTNWLQSFFCRHYQLELSFSPGPLCSFSKCTYSKLSNRRAAKGLVFAKDWGPKKLNEVAPLLWHLFLWNEKWFLTTVDDQDRINSRRRTNDRLVALLGLPPFSKVGIFTRSWGIYCH